MDTREDVLGIAPVSYCDYMRVVLALGYVCTELMERVNMQVSSEVVALAKHIAGERGRCELTHASKAFSGLYGLFRPPMAQGGFADESK